MPDLAAGKSPCAECARLAEQYASASAKCEWAKADLISARFLHDANAIKTAQLNKADAVREWEIAKADLEEHVNAHNQERIS